MRVLFVSTPGIGHMFPMVPTAWALRAAGHEVLVATTGPARAAAQAGLSVVDVAPGLDRQTLRAQMLRTQPQQVARLRSAPLQDLREAAAFLALTSVPLIDGTVALAAEWQADLVVQSQVQGAGLIAAAKRGVPLVQHGFGIARTAGMAELLREHLSEEFDRYAVADLPRVMANIDVAPPSLLEGPPEGWSMRYVPYNGGGVLPGWLREPSAKPRVAVTLGSELRGGGVAPARRIVEAAAALNVELVLALGEVDTAELGTLPDYVRLAGWVPLSELLPTCVAIVHHGGAGTTLTSLALGVPQLIFSGPADRHINATAVAARGAGLATEPDQLNADLLRRLLQSAALVDAAQQVRREIEAMPSPAEIVPRLVTLARRHEA